MTGTMELIPERDEIEMLLPWYVTRRLSAADKARVEAWLARDADLARQLALIEDEQRETVHGNEAIRLPARSIVDSVLLDLQSWLHNFGR